MGPGMVSTCSMLLECIVLNEVRRRGFAVEQEEEWLCNGHQTPSRSVHEFLSPTQLQLRIFFKWSITSLVLLCVKTTIQAYRSELDLKRLIHTSPRSAVGLGQLLLNHIRRAAFYYFEDPQLKNNYNYI
jgi:hypothetical protein